MSESAATSDWRCRLVALRPEGRNPPLFCVHSSDGGTLAYEELAAAMSPEQPVFVCCAPDIEGSARVVTVEELANLYVQEIRSVGRAGPYQLCGQSFGGLVAYEMAALMQREGDEITVLALLDTRHPQYWANLNFRAKTQFVHTYLSDRVVKYLRNALTGRLGRVAGEARHYIVRRVRSFVWRTLRLAAGASGQSIPRAVQAQAMSFAAASRAYTPGFYSGPTVLFCAEERAAEYCHDETLGWRVCTDSNLAVQFVRGGHVTMMQQPSVSDLASKLTQYLARAACGRPA